MLGPSGSGKTTTLRMIAGFEEPDAGTVELDGEDVTGVPPYDRSVNTVFQDYALFPHMTVADNVEYGLKVAGADGAERARRRRRGARDGAPGPDYGDRKPSELSGGQRQRVALARAIVEPTAGAAARRAARRARPEAARADAGRAEADPDGGRDHLRLRHPRPGGGADDVGPDRGLQRGPDRAGRPAGRGLRAVRPTPSSAASSGVSNVLERDGKRFTVRPEKIRLLGDGEARDGLHTERGRIGDVAYAGMITRYIGRAGRGRRAPGRYAEPRDRRRPRTLETHGRETEVGWRPEHTVAVSETAPEERE